MILFSRSFCGNLFCTSAVPPFFFFFFKCLADEFKIRSQLDGQPSVGNWKPSALSISTPKYFLMFRLDDVMKT